MLGGAPEPTRAAIEAALPQFTGEIWQRPPRHSAVKVGGQRAYDLARRGQAFELPPRTVTVHRLTVTRYHYPEVEMEIECGSGTYVRALGRDLAEALGTAAVMSALERTAIGRFRLEDAVPVDELNDDSLAQYLQPPSAAVADLPRVELTDNQLTEIRFGRSIVIESESSDPVIHWAGFDSGGRLASILYEKHPGQLWPVRNFAT
jgi:tRNA pseudouridine55 synthase